MGAAGAVENGRHPVRLFYALTLSQREQEALQRQQRALMMGMEHGKPTPREKLHMTLQFLGERSEMDLPRIQGIMEHCAKLEHPFSMNLCRYGCFPGRGEEKLWYITGCCPGAVRLAEDLKRHLEYAGFPVEQREFLPHITLIRRGILREAFCAPEPEPVPVVTDQIVLLESRQRGDGVQYIPLASAALK